MVFQISWDFGIAAEVVDIFQFTFWRFDRFTEQGKRFDGIVEAFLALFQTILHQHFRICAAGTVIEFGRVNRDGVLDFFEQVFVVHDVAEIFVFTVEAVDAADGLEEAVILHGLVDVEIGAGRRVEASQQFIHDHQQFHVVAVLW